MLALLYMFGVSDGEQCTLLRPKYSQEKRATFSGKNLLMLKQPRFISLVFSFCLLFCTQTHAQTHGIMSSQQKSFNPDIGVNFLGLLQRGTALSSERSKTPHNGLSLQEAELQFNADVDVYFKAVALFSVAQKSDSTDFGFDPEEVYVESLSLPSITVRAGKFKLALGKHNQLHTHAFPFIDAPLIQQQLLGDEGLNEVGISTAALLPTVWYSELILQAFNPSNETLYNSRSSGDVGGLARVKSLWDLTDDLTLELGASGTTGENQFGRTSTALGGDLTFKWRPSVGGKYQALIWSTEYLDGKRLGQKNSDTGEEQEQLGGLATWLQYQFAQRWWAQVRHEFVGLPRAQALSSQNKQSALIGFFPSEFSGVRLQYDWLRNHSKDKAEHTIAIQYNISIGAHPAHAY